MNVIIFGCGNVGLAAAQLLCDAHNLLLIGRRFSPEVREFVQTHNRTSFTQADATDPLAVERAIASFGKKAEHVDALISTVGAACSASVLDDPEAFAGDLTLNFFGNLVPIKGVLDRMIAARAGRIVILSSTSGVFAYPGLTAYVPAKWALTGLCETLRNEVKRYGISVDVVFPASIRNRRSRTFLYDKGVEVDRVAAEVGRILRTTGGADSFVPRRYALLRPLERGLPQLLDRRAALNHGRKGRFRARRINSVRIWGAACALGRDLAALYAPTVERLDLVGSNRADLLEVRRQIAGASNCRISVSDLNVADGRALQRFVAEATSTDLLVYHCEGGVTGQIKDMSSAAFRSAFHAGFLGPIRLLAGLLRQHKISSKIIMVLSAPAVEGRPGHGCSAAVEGATWAFVRALRRTIGNDLQVMEVLVDRARSTAMSGAVARRILEWERSGTEIAIVPLTLKLSMWGRALAPRWNDRLACQIDNHDTDGATV